MIFTSSKFFKMNKFKSGNEALQFYNLKQAPDIDKKNTMQYIISSTFYLPNLPIFFFKLEYAIYIRRPVESKTSV